jgi:polysaccharide export outer membrane protein
MAKEAPETVTSVTVSQFVHIGVGDQIRVEVFDSTDLNSTTTVTADGTIRLPLVGAVMVKDLSPTEADEVIERAYKEGEFLVDPHITVTVVQSSSQRVPVTGEVRSQGRYALESNTTVLDLIAMAGGITDKASDIVYIVRPTESGSQRLPVDLRAFTSVRDSNAPPVEAPRSGDSIVVPRATFFINGEVSQPGEYRVEGDMVLFMAVARAGNLTPMGSASRIVIRRRGADGKFVDIKADLKDKKHTRIEPGDVITVKERFW